MKKWTKTLLVSLGLSLIASHVIIAQQTQSTNYGINEYFIGPGGDLDLNSASYNARATLGDLGIGNSGSTNYQIYGGFTTTDVPYLEFTVNATTIDMGTLTATSTGTGTATFSVRTYLAEGYVVSVGGTLPTLANSSATIDAIAAQTASTQGTEQFGFNLAANTSPSVFGAVPVQVPDATFSFGAATDEYNDDGLFKYDATDSIASSASSSGQTDYTVSYILNVSEITDAGIYTASQSFIATSTF